MGNANGTGSITSVTGAITGLDRAITVSDEAPVSPPSTGTGVEVIDPWLQ
jgi:hypothetical protein